MLRRVWRGGKRGMKMLIINHICNSPFQIRKNITDERSKYSLCFTTFQKKYYAILSLCMFTVFSCYQARLSALIKSLSNALFLLSFLVVTFSIKAIFGKNLKSYKGNDSAFQKNYNLIKEISINNVILHYFVTTFGNKCIKTIKE